MKKVIFSIIVGLGASTGAIAAQDIPSGVPISTTDCPVLAEAATLNLSSGVVGAYTCSDLTREIKIGTCSINGSRKAGEVDCVSTPAPTAADPDALRWNGPGCTSETDKTQVLNNSRAYSATSAGGRVAPNDLGAVCSQETISGFAYLEEE